MPPVALPDNAHGQVTAIARCRGEDGTLWDDVAVRISLDGTRETESSLCLGPPLNYAGWSETDAYRVWYGDG
jgi:hypothetical protein